MTNEEVDRRAEILNAAVELFGTLGYYGTSLQKIADRVGLTKAGVLHYVGSKEGLLTAALDEVYDSETEDILTDIVREPRPLIADMWRRIVAVNARRPLQVHMFSTLSAEAIDPNHPAHEYFANRELHNADTALNIRWRVPEGVNTRRLLNAGFAMMDGVQLRWLRTPGQDLNAMWAECEDTLFPLPCGRLPLSLCTGTALLYGCRRRRRHVCGFCWHRTRSRRPLRLKQSHRRWLVALSAATRRPNAGFCRFPTVAKD